MASHRSSKRRFAHVYALYERLRKKLSLSSPTVIEIDKNDHDAYSQIVRALIQERVRRRIDKVFGIEVHLLHDERVAASWANRGFEVPHELRFRGQLPLVA